MVNILKMRTWFPTQILVISAIVAMSACSSSGLTVPTAKFSQAVSQSADGIEGEFAGEFDYWQSSYIQMLAIDGKPIDPAFLEGKAPSDVQGRVSFSPQAIALRIKAVDGIKAYAESLGSLAGSTAPADFATNSNAIATNLSQLVSEASKTDGSKFEQYAGPLSAIAGWCGQQYLENGRDQAISDAVTKVAPQFKAVLAQLKTDLGYLRDDKDGIASRLLALRIHQFNKAAAPGHEQDMLNLGNKVLDLENSRQSLSHYAAIDTLDAWGKAHDAILKYLQSSKSPEDLASLSAEIDSFSGRIQPLVQAVADLKKIK